MSQGYKVTWGGDDNFTIIEEEWLKDKKAEISLELVLSVYRNLRENYEFRLRYDDADKFFIKEMELKRKYRNVRSKISPKDNGWLRRNLSFTGIYYHFSTYGERIVGDWWHNCRAFNAVLAYAKQTDT